jgi:hypothetical protein
MSLSGNFEYFHHSAMSIQFFKNGPFGWSPCKFRSEIVEDDVIEDRPIKTDAAVYEGMSLLASSKSKSLSLGILEKLDMPGEFL